MARLAILDTRLAITDLAAATFGLAILDTRLAITDLAAARLFVASLLLWRHVAKVTAVAERSESYSGSKSVLANRV